jgi:hypothetical protein
LNFIVSITTVTKFIADDVLISFKDDHSEENRIYFDKDWFSPQFILFSAEKKKMRFIQHGIMLDRVINLPDIDPSHWKVEDDHMSETQIFNSQIKFMIEREGKYFGFGCKSFSVFTKKDGNDYEVKKTSENVNFANVTLIESEYLYVIQEAVDKRASGFYIQDLTSFIDIKDDG